MTHYQILKVPQNATHQEIRDAHRQQVMIHHPDKGGSTALFQQIQAAYEVLSNPERRRNYDQAESQKPVESLRGSMDILVNEFFDTLCTP